MPTKTHSLALYQPPVAGLGEGKADLGLGKIVIPSQLLFVENRKLYVHLWLTGFVASFVPALERHPLGRWVLVAVGIF